MAGLETYDGETPAGEDSLNQGDNKLRELGQKTKASLDVDHHLSGEHNIPRGTTGQKPAATKDGRLYIVENIGQEAELEYANGSIWIRLSKNNEVTTIQIDIDALESNLAAHIASNPIDHQNESVTSVKVKKGHILRKHINSVDANQEGSVASLVNGTELPDNGTWHTHPAGVGGGGSGLWTFLANVVEIASGSGTSDWVIKNLASSGIPATAVGVILQAKGNGFMDSGIGVINCNIKIRKNSSSDSLYLIGSGLVTDFSYLGHMGQGIYPVDTSSGSAKLQYKSEGYFTSWSIDVIGYFE